MNLYKSIIVSKFYTASVVEDVYITYQSSVGEWLRLWVNLGLAPSLSNWEVVGSNPTAGMSRIGFVIQARHFNGFS